MTKTLEQIIEETKEKFYDKLVHVDHGPDHDDHDCEPDTWQDYFKGYDEKTQISYIEQFIKHHQQATWNAALESVKEKIQEIPTTTPMSQAGGAWEITAEDFKIAVLGLLPTLTTEER